MITHLQLVELAANFLWRNNLHGACPVVITELASQAPEHPDAIGFRHGFSVLIECKVSRADFRADRDKHFRRYDYHSMGNFRYYLAPADMISVEELPEGWGLLEQRGAKVYLAKKSDHFKQSDRAYEIEILCSALRRQVCSATASVRVKTYVLDEGGEPRASIYVPALPKPDEDLFGDDEKRAPRTQPPQPDEDLFD